MRVVGWAETRRLPVSEAGCRVGQITVLTTSDLMASSQDRLAVLQRIFEAGIDFVPISPAEVADPRRGVAIAKAHHDSILHELVRQRGHGQFSLILSMKPPKIAPTAQENGRAWLHQRMQDYHRHARLRERLCALAAATAYPMRNLVACDNAARCDVLVPRSRAADFPNVLRHIAAEADCADHLRISGLWAPLGFAPTLQEDASVAAS